MRDVEHGQDIIRRRIGPVAYRLRRIAAALAWATLSLVAVTLPAATAERSAMVIDANSGTVLYNSSGDAQRYPASLTKMMTLYMAFDLIEKGRLSYSDTIPITAQAAAQPPSKLGLEPGDRIVVRDAVRALVTKSANDIAVALAEHIGGSEANFARLMTKRARDIGMSKTTFKNASGLPNDEQTTTARDMLTLALRLQDDFPEHFKVFSTRAFSFKGSTHRNHNTLLYHYRGTDGIKTGYTRASGFNLVTSVHRDGRHLVAAVFGGSSAGSRNAEMRVLLDRSFARASNKRTRARSPQLIAKPMPAKRPARELAATPATPPSKPAPHATTAAAAVIAKPAPAARPVTPSPAADSMPPAPAADDISSKIAVARVRPVMLGTPAEGSIATQRNGAIVPAATGDSPIAMQDAAELEGRGRAPSTLHEQLANILAANRRPPVAAAVATAPEPPPYQLRGPVDAPEARPAQAPEEPAAKDRSGRVAPGGKGSGGNFVIQIGAFDSASEAERRLIQAKSTAARVLAGSSPVTEPVAKGDKQLYRARFAGFDSGAATAACIELRRHAIDCMVARVR